MNPPLLLAQAMVHHQKGDLAEAERLYTLFLADEPASFEACHFLGLVCSQQGRTAEALDWIGRALQINPRSAEALSNQGNALRTAGRPLEAVASFNQALASRPGFLPGLFNRANVLMDLGRPEEALADYDRSLAIDPGFAAGWNNRGNALRSVRRPADALATYERALALRPAHPETLNNRAIALWELGRSQEALAECGRALAVNPRFADAWNTGGNILTELNRPDEALASYEKALAANPGHPHALNGAAQAALGLCDWTRTPALTGALKTGVAAGTAIVQPFLLLGYWDDPGLQRLCAANYVRRVIPAQAPLWNGTPHRHGKIRLAYLSADFRKSAAAYLTAELFESHDRSRFEVTAISFGPDDGSDMRARIVKAFDRFEDVRAHSDREVAEKLAEREIDIAVDLMGYTLNARPGILSHRPCPVQVSWLGFPATMAADFIDYVIADATVLPKGADDHFAEKIVRLPHSYYPCDSANPISPRTPARAEAGLPQHAFVFCNFNNNWKITEAVFDVWMRLLAQVPGSVLWLLPAHPTARENLRHQAAARGIDPERLVFAARMETEDHLARHRLADLFLDTLPYNAHTTAIDALWAGLPVITCMGESFCARVAASLLNAVDLSELVTGNLQDYEALALRLAREPALLAKVREKLGANRERAPLFDADGFRKAMEAAYLAMWETSQKGKRPDSFAVPPG